MEGNIDVCTTGILIDFEDHESISVDTDFQLNLHKHTSDAEKVQFSDNCESLCITERFNDLHLGDGLNAKREMLTIPKSRWETPSPKSMKKICQEASKIIDQLYSSPLEDTEAFLVDEDSPVSLKLDSGSLNGSSPEYEKIPERNLPSTKHNMSSSLPPIDDCPVSQKVPERNEDSTEDNIPELSKSSVDAQVIPTAAYGPDVSKPADVKLENHVPDNISPSIEHSEPISTNIKSKDIVKDMNGNGSKIGKGSKIINKENGSKIKTIISSGIKSLSDKKIFKRNALEESNSKDIGIIKSKPNVEISFKRNVTDVIPEKINNIPNMVSQNSLIGTNRRNSVILPRTSNVSQYQLGSRQKTTLCKTSSVVETPKATKFVRRSNSFQTQIGKNSTIKKLDGSSEQNSFISNRNSIKKISNLKTPTESSIKPVKSRMSICQLPNNGNGFNTPLKRSNSLTKSSRICTSQIPGPSMSMSSRKITSVTESSQQLFKRPVLSTSSRVRFSSRLGLPSTLPPIMNDNLPRKLFPELKAPMKR